MGRDLQSLVPLIIVLILLFTANSAFTREQVKISLASQECISCHENITPGIVSDWENSRMARVTPADALSLPVRKRRISAESVPEPLLNNVVGCAECHTSESGRHTDTFDHWGTPVHTVVTPANCSVCHPAEHDQFNDNLMSRAYGNLTDNKLYEQLVNSINGPMTLTEKGLIQSGSDETTNADACLSCHGTRLAVEKTVTRQTLMGEMDFPDIKGWPNHGVGRINPDGTKGNCAACHSRHRFAIEMARKPETCSECHKGPDVPAYKIYSVSKHGNIYNAMGKSGNWDFDEVPWQVGKDFSAPTCAACHVSMLSDPTGNIRIERTHRMNDRLAWRLFGLPYAHAHPKSADTRQITSKDGLPLPTALDGTPADDFLISESEMDERTSRLKQVCSSCHSSGWTDGHFRKLEHVIETTNASTLTATRILSKGWEKGIVSGPAAGESPFDEALERKWVEQWLFYANSTRFASAMSGADYGVFANGRWYLSKTIREMFEMLERDEDSK